MVGSGQDRNIFLRNMLSQLGEIAAAQYFAVQFFDSWVTQDLVLEFGKLTLELRSQLLSGISFILWRSSS